MASASYLAERESVLLGIHWQVVPPDLALHEGNASSECGACDHRSGQARGWGRDRGCYRRLAVAVHAVDIPGEGSPPFLERLERNHIPGVAERLLAVHIYDRDQAVKPMV